MLNPRLNNDSGFTLIEIVIAVLLLGVISAIVLRTLVGSLDYVGRSQATARAASQTQTAMQRMSSEIEHAISPGRSTKHVPNKITLRTALYGTKLDGGTAPTTYASATTGTTVDVRDIVVAGPNYLEFRSAAETDSSNDDPICVVYKLLSGDLVRETYRNTYSSAATCKGPFLARSVLLRGARHAQ